MAKVVKTTTVETNQIVLTQEQYNALINIYAELDRATDQIAELILKDYNQIQLGYNLGMINNDLQRAYNTLDELTDAINPNKWWDEDEDENN
jgi:hypothetical protein